MNEPGEWLTIAQAADRLGIQERRARRYAQRLPDSDRTLDRTPAGRERALVRVSALLKLLDAAQSVGQRPDIAPDTDRTENAPSVGLAIAYEGVIREQAAHIASLQATLDHERAQAHQLNQQAERLADALAREQSLRLLDTTAPPPPGFWAWLHNLSRHPMPRNNEDGVK